MPCLKSEGYVHERLQLNPKLLKHLLQATLDELQAYLLEL